MDNFAIRGNTIRLTASANAMQAGSARQVMTGTGFTNATAHTIFNFGPAIAFIGYGPDADTAVANAKPPTPGDSVGTFCIVMGPGARSIEASPKSYFAAMTENGVADILITPGAGAIEGFGDGLASQAQSNAAMLAMLRYLDGSQRELLEQALTELRTLTYFVKEGLNVADDPEAIRSDNAATIN